MISHATLMVITISLAPLVLATPRADSYGGHKDLKDDFMFEQGMQGHGMDVHGHLDGLGVHGYLDGMPNYHLDEKTISIMSMQYGLIPEDLRYFGSKGIYPLPTGHCTCPPALIIKKGFMGADMGGHGGYQGGKYPGGHGGYDHEGPYMFSRGNFGDDDKPKGGDVNKPDH